MIYGVPENLDNPDTFTPTPWEAYTYDSNDNAGRTHGVSPQGANSRHAWNTPASITIDALGRVVEAAERNRTRLTNGAWSAIEVYRTVSSYDIRSNLLTVTDALGRRAFGHIYDLANRALYIESIDAGVRRSVLDAAGSLIERRDSKGALVLSSYDALNRLTHRWPRKRRLV